MTWKHLDYTINIDDQGKFSCTMEDKTHTAFTLNELRDKIDLAIKQREKTNRRKLSIPVVTLEGSKYTLTGVHAAHGSFLTSPSLANEGKFGGKPNLYLDLPIVGELSAELRQLKKRASEIEDSLKAFVLEPPYKAYGKEIDHDAAITRLEAQYEATKVPA